MSQLQHPSADNAGGAIGNGYTTTEANYWSALDTSGDSKSITGTTDINAGNFSAELGLITGPAIGLSYNAVTDPGINTDHKVRVRLKWHQIIIADSFTELFIQVAFGGVGHNFKIASPTPGQGILPDVFVTVEWTMTSGEVDHYRANGGYNGTIVSTPQGFLVSYSDVFPPDHASQSVTIDFVEVEVPDEPTPPLDIIGSGGFTISGSADMSVSPQITGSGGIEFSGSATVITSVDVSGIYELILDKRNDTLYARDSDDDTIDVKIPRPHYKTAYFGS